MKHIFGVCVFPCSQVYNAQNLASMGGLKLVIESLNSTDHRMQENSAFVLGPALSRYTHTDTLTFAFMHLADAFIQSDFEERALQKSIGH